MGHHGNDTLQQRAGGKKRGKFKSYIMSSGQVKAKRHSMVKGFAEIWEDKCILSTQINAVTTSQTVI